MEWIKVWTRKWLWGSGRTMTPEKRGVWMDLLALAGEAKLRDGTLRFDVGKPMTREYIRNVLMLDSDTLDACLVAFEADINADDGQPRIKVWDDGTIQITNWDRFQGKPDKVKAKEVAIERGKATRKAKDDAVLALTRITNELNITAEKMKKNLHYELRDGKIVDTATGEVYEPTAEDLSKSGGKE